VNVDLDWSFGKEGSNVHSGPTPRGLGGSEAAFAVAERRGRRRAIVFRRWFPMFVGWVRNWSFRDVAELLMEVPHIGLGAIATPR
jgi:hypothetical protein